MSALAGICYWDERRVPDSELVRLATHSQQAAPDSEGRTARPYPWLAIQAFVLRFDELSTVEHQPHHAANGSVLTWDGRLDNREDLLIVLHDSLAGDITDAALAHAAYERWGVDGLRRLIGDWSLAIWDPTSRSITLACDSMGGRPLYYREMSNGLAWATRLEALVACFDLYAQPDEGYIVGRLGRGVPAAVTPFHSVRALLAGHVLVAKSDYSIRVRRYWTFEPATIRYRDPNEYTERLRELLEEAVRVRLRSNRTVWCHLSGGWDSSSVTCLAHRLIARCRTAPQLQPVSLVHRGVWADRDEGRFITAVEHWCQLRTSEILYAGFAPIGRLLGRWLPGDTAAQIFDDIEAPMIDAGDRVILTGAYGDDVMIQNNAQTTLLEALHSGHVRRFWHLCVGRARDKHIPVALILARMVQDTYLPTLGRLLHRTRLANLRIQPRHIGWGLTPELLNRNQEPPLTSIPSLREFPTAKQPLVRFLYQLGKPAPFHWTGNAAIYRTHVYTHRPLLEFMIGAPGGAFQEPGLPPRMGMRQALKAILPPELLDRNQKGLAGSSVARSERNQVDELDQLGPLSDWELVSRGYLDHATVSDAITRFRCEGAFHMPFPTKWIYLEAWLQTLRRRASILRDSELCPAVDLVFSKAMRREN